MIVSVDTVRLEGEGVDGVLGGHGYDEFGDMLMDSVGRGSGVVRVYGYRIASDHPTWGEVTAVMSFRNDSNGYYGGELVPAGPNADLPEWRRVPFDPDEWDQVPTITDDVVETEPSKS